MRTKIWDRVEGTGERCCGRCSHYAALTNLGLWWCCAGHTENMVAETCDDYTDSLKDMTILSATLSTANTYVSSTSSHPMAVYKIMRARKRRRKERGTKH